jgi:hypothetical protein
MSDYNNPRLYELAKQITLEQGFDYHHPLTGEVSRAKRAEAKPKAAKSVKRKAQSKQKPRPRRQRELWHLP